jgi:hypothetical protein
MCQGTIIFVTARVQGGDDGWWLRAPDGWILERHPAFTSEETGIPLYSVLPLMGPTDSATPTQPAQSAAKAVAPSSRVASTAERGREEVTREVPSVKAEGAFYSRHRNSGLLDRLDRMASPTCAVGQGGADGQQQRRAPFSATLDSDDTANESSQSSAASRYEHRAVSTTGQLAECLHKLDHLLSSNENGDYQDLRNVVSATVQKLPSTTQSLRRRQVIAMQASMEQVAQNLVQLSQSVLDCQRALSELSKGEPLLQRCVHVEH